MILNFFGAREFCFDASFDVPFFCDCFDFPCLGNQNFDRKMEHQNLHKNKIRARQKNSKSPNFANF